MNAEIPNYPKRASNRDRILDLLQDGQRHHMSEMERIGGMRFGARVWELRKLGHDIITHHIGADETAYELIRPEPIEPEQLVLIG